MTATPTTTVDPTMLAGERRPSFGQVRSDARTMTWRNLLRVVRNPQLLVFATVQPIIFVLMFRYVFGGAIKIPGVPYVDFLMPGIWIQTITFGSITTAVGLAEDLQGGLIERFRSLPMARSSVLIGRTFADLVRNVFVVSLMTAVGFIVGFRFHTSWLALLAALGLVLLFSYAISWAFALIGLSVPDAETAQAAAFPFLAVFVFASASFVPVSTMPGWLQAFAKNQPVTAVVDGVRALVLGGPTASDVLVALAWTVGITVVFAPLAIRRYRKVA